MLTPPHLITLVHAGQQPMGRPEFTRLDVQYNKDIASDLSKNLETEFSVFIEDSSPSLSARQLENVNTIASDVFDAIVPWREPGNTPPTPPPPGDTSPPPPSSSPSPRPRPRSTDVYLMGALQVHKASTAKVDLRAKWTDDIDDLPIQIILHVNKISQHM